MKSKKCTKCKEVKPLDEFFKQRRNKDGHHGYCKECHTSCKPGRARHGYRQRKRESTHQLISEGKLRCSRCKIIRPLDIFNKNRMNLISGYNTICNECYSPGYCEIKKEKEELLKAGKKKCNKCKIIKSLDDFHKNNHERGSDRHATCKKCHYKVAQAVKERDLEKWKAFHRDYSRQWNKDNPERFRQYQKERLKNPVHKLRKLVSWHINAALRRNDGSKAGESVLKYLPYTMEELKEHLEKQFQKGMSWDNHALDGWHIDHIYPQTKLPFKSMDHPNFQKCWALENLQPLWAFDNHSKGNRILDEYLL